MSRRALSAEPAGMPPLQSPLGGRRDWPELAWTMALAAMAVAVFVQGFLLTRVELPEFSACGDALQEGWPVGELADGGGSGCWGPPAYERVVLVVVDALRYDMVVPPPGGASKMPRLLAIHQKASDASHLARFVADPPTTTMQRLKGIFTGSLPTFLDVGNAFSATHVTEDSLFRQLSASGRRVAFVGDDTWQSLFPEYLHQAWPYPSMNVHDLHTVDQGVWQHLPLLLGAPQRGQSAGWEVLVAHTLGVDHAGHTHAVRSPEMDAKLDETDARVTEAVEAALALAAPGGPHERTLMVVMGDHGQTLNGDHGGGTPEETDTVLLALNLGRLHRATSGTPTGSGAAAGTAAEESRGELGEAPPMPQLSLLPTLSLLMGLPIPYGSIGAASPHLWALSTAGLPPPAAARSFRLALARNAWQVRRYLAAYHGPAPGRFNRARFASCMALYDTAAALAESATASRVEGGPDSRNNSMSAPEEERLRTPRSWPPPGISLARSGRSFRTATWAPASRAWRRCSSRRCASSGSVSPPAVTAARAWSCSP